MEGIGNREGVEIGFSSVDSVAHSDGVVWGNILMSGGWWIVTGAPRLSQSGSQVKGGVWERRAASELSLTLAFNARGSYCLTKHFHTSPQLTCFHFTSSCVDSVLICFHKCCSSARGDCCSRYRASMRHLQRKLVSGWFRRSISSTRPRC